MSTITNIINYIKNTEIATSISSYTTKTSSIASTYFFSKKATEDTFTYVDKTKCGKIISSTKVKHLYPIPSNRSYIHHDSLEALCTHIALTRNPNAGTKLKLEASNASFSSRNRGDLTTEVSLSKGLKKLLGIESWSDKEVKDFFKIESLYKKNSEFNGHSYPGINGKTIKIDSAIASSADRKASPTQNLTLVKSGGEHLLYTGRPDTLEKAKEQALFILSHKLNIPLLSEADSSDTPSTEMPKWLKGKNEFSWNAKSKTIELPYVVYSIMSDSKMLSDVCKIKNDPASNEKKFLEVERETLATLKKEPIYVKDSSGTTFKLHCKPIFLSQGFNSFDLIKGFVGEGSLSPAITGEGWNELSLILKQYPAKINKLQKHIDILSKYFKGTKHLSNLHFFLHMNIILLELNKENKNLPIVLHCKSSTDRTGIGAAILTTLRQFERLSIPIPNDMAQLTKDLRFKELFFLNWVPTWHQRSKFSRDIEGISFGKDLGQNPILLDVLPERFLNKKKECMLHNTASAFFAGTNALAHEIYRALHVDSLFSYSLNSNKMKPEMLNEKMAILAYSNMQRRKLCYLPNTYLNERIHKFRSVSSSAMSPLEKHKRPWLLYQ